MSLEYFTEYFPTTVARLSLMNRRTGYQEDFPSTAMFRFPSRLSTSTRRYFAPPWIIDREPFSRDCGNRRKNGMRRSSVETSMRRLGNPSEFPEVRACAVLFLHTCTPFPPSDVRFDSRHMNRLRKKTARQFEAKGKVLEPTDPQQRNADWISGRGCQLERDSVPRKWENF